MFHKARFVFTVRRTVIDYHCIGRIIDFIHAATVDRSNFTELDLPAS